MTVHIQGDSKEAMAYQLMVDIASSENIVFASNPDSGTPATKEWILNTYRHCLSIVTTPR